MAAFVKLHRSATPGATPSSLQEGSLGVNLSDGRIFTANSTTIFDALRQVNQDFRIANNSGGALRVGNSTINAIINSTSVSISNSTVTLNISRPTSVQQSNTSTFLHANGSWVYVPPAPSKAAIVYVIDGGANAITTGVKGDLSIPFGCQIQNVVAMADASGNIVVDIWKDTYANYPPVDADSITASAPVTLSSAAKASDSTLSGWTKTINESDILRFNVDSAATIKRLTITLNVTKT